MTQVIFTEIPQVSDQDAWQDRWQWQVTARRIPRHAVADLQHTADIIAKANDILQRARNEAHHQRQQAFAQGTLAAEKAVASAIAEGLLRVEQEAKTYLDAAEPRVVQLVFAVLRRVLPQLSPDLVLENLVEEALRAVQDRHSVRVCINPDMESSAQALVEQWRQRLPDIQHLELTTDDRLAPTECRVESPYGHVSVNMQDRFEKIVRAYEQTLQQQTLQQQKSAAADD